MGNMILRIFKDGSFFDEKASMNAILGERQKALERAREKMRGKDSPNQVKHFVYYAEYENKAVVYMNPIEMTDKDFYERTEAAHANYIGALHRR